MHKTGTKIFVKANRIVKVKATISLLQHCDVTYIHMGEGTVDKQQKVRKTEIMDKNNYAKHHELIHHFGECFYCINS